VVYFTAQICGIALTDLNVLPKGPLIAFLVVQNGGYLVAFTAGGQTLGKMLAGIRVVATESTEPLDLGRALVRTALWVLLAVPAGLGFLSAVLSHNHPGLHDRFPAARVVRAWGSGIVSPLRQFSTRGRESFRGVIPAASRISCAFSAVDHL